MKNVFYTCLVLLAFGCSNDKATPDQTAIDLVTGITFRQAPDDSPQVFGNPNVRVSNQFVLYPNPVHQTILLESPSLITSVWVVPAHAQKIYQTANFATILNASTYSETAISSHATLSLSGQSNNTVTMTIATLPEGYYRVFVKIGGTLYWDNLYVDPIGTEAHIAEIIGFWN
jgi:hypothetical protein